MVAKKTAKKKDAKNKAVTSKDSKGNRFEPNPDIVERTTITQIGDNEAAEILYNGMLTRDSPAQMEIKYNLQKGIYFKLISKFKRDGALAMTRKGKGGKKKNIPHNLKMNIQKMKERVTKVNSSINTLRVSLDLMQDNFEQYFTKEGEK